MSAVGRQSGAKDEAENGRKIFANESQGWIRNRISQGKELESRLHMLRRYSS